MMAILNLIRWKNLLMLALVQALIKYALFVPNYAVTSLTNLQFLILVSSTLFIAAAGYVINDIYDIETDTINRPSKVVVGKYISEKAANNLFISLNVVGVMLGFYLSNSIGKSSFFALFVLISALLYIYASYLKQSFLIGNIVVSFLVAFSIILVGLFDLIPSINDTNSSLQLAIFKLVLGYAFFAFIINFLREITKDIQDIDGDHKAGMNTLPIILGRTRANSILFILTLIANLLIIYVLITYLYTKTNLIIYFLILVVGPLILTTIKIFNAETKKDYQLISNLLKMVMLTGMLSMLFHTTFIK